MRTRAQIINDIWKERERALTAENAKLRAEVERLKAHKPDVFGMVDALRLDLARVTEHEASLERQLEDTLTWRNSAIDEARSATADLARVTAERDGLAEAVEAELYRRDHYDPSNDDHAREYQADEDALRAAVAAVKG